MNWLIGLIFRILGIQRPAVALWLVVKFPDGRTIILKGNNMALTLPVDKKVTATIRPVDAYGNAARVDGVPVWSCSVPDVLEITPAADGMSAVIEPVGPVGNVQLKVEADADLGSGVRTITTLADIEVVGGDAVGFEVSFGPLEPR